MCVCVCVCVCEFWVRGWSRGFGVGAGSAEAFLSIWAVTGDRLGRIESLPREPKGLESSSLKQKQRQSVNLQKTFTWKIWVPSKCSGHLGQRSRVSPRFCLTLFFFPWYCLSPTPTLFDFFSHKPYSSSSFQLYKLPTYFEQCFADQREIWKAFTVWCAR